MPDFPEDLKNANALDPSLIERARADAARLVGGMSKEFDPADEPAHIYVADLAS